MLGDHVNYSGFGTNYLTPLKPLSNRPSALLMQPKAAALRTLGYEKLLPAVHIIYFKSLILSINVRLWKVTYV